jgi:large subunit ribosomal protein L10
MARQDKVATVTEIADRFRASAVAVLTDYRGLSVAQMKDLRRSLGPTVTFSVVKNTLTKRAAADAGIDGIDALLVGPSAIAFVEGDPVDAAKGIRNFAKDHPALIVKGGYMDGALLSPEDFTKLANLESREVLLSKLAGAMKAKQSQAAALFAAPLAKAARAVGALQTKLESDPSAASALQALLLRRPLPRKSSKLAAEETATEAAAPEAVVEEASTEEATTETPDAPAEETAEAAETTEG